MCTKTWNIFKKNLIKPPGFSARLKCAPFSGSNDTTTWHVINDFPSEALKTPMFFTLPQTEELDQLLDAWMFFFSNVDPNFDNVGTYVTTRISPNITTENQITTQLTHGKNHVGTVRVSNFSNVTFFAKLGNSSGYFHPELHGGTEICPNQLVAAEIWLRACWFFKHDAEYSILERIPYMLRSWCTCMHLFVYHCMIFCKLKAFVMWSALVTIWFYSWIACLHSHFDASLVNSF